MIPTFTLELPVLPVPAPILPLQLGITPASSGGVVIVLAGSSIGGSSAVYSDLNGLSAYTGAAGFMTTNRGRKGIGRTARGVEDGKNSRK